jgi:hypothetical protein
MESKAEAKRIGIGKGKETKEKGKTGNLPEILPPSICSSTASPSSEARGSGSMFSSWRIPQGRKQKGGQKRGSICMKRREGAEKRKKREKLGFRRRD